MKLLIEQNEDGGKRRNAAKKKELEAAEKRIGELSAIFKRLYEDSVGGRISDERFTELSADCEAEQQEFNQLDKLNTFPKDSRYQTFLLDKYNKVVCIGNPTENPQIDVYKRQV